VLASFRVPIDVWNWSVRSIEEAFPLQEDQAWSDEVGDLDKLTILVEASLNSGVGNQTFLFH
jgi:hypothetical protein